MMARRATATATTRVGERPASGTATVAFTPAFSIPNKPMVPTAHACFNEHPIDPVRRHMGRPFGSKKTAIGPWREPVGEVCLSGSVAQMMVIR